MCHIKVSEAPPFIKLLNAFKGKNKIVQIRLKYLNPIEMVANANEILKDLYANLSWYKTHSSYNDPMYQRQLTVLSETLQKVIPKTEFALVVDMGNAIAWAAVPKWGSIPCFVPGKEAYMDSYLSCALFQLPFVLENINFAYICSIVIIPIMLISLFGKIKENYRWFLLNQALWDAFTCYSFICEKPSVLSWSGGSYTSYTTCFYTGYPSNQLLGALYTLIKGSFRNAPYIPLFLLAFSRCISLYFPTFYQRHNQSWKVISFIVIFDAAAIFSSSFLRLWSRLISFIKVAGYQNCFEKFCPEYTNYTAEVVACMKKNQKYFNCQSEWSIWWDYFQVEDRHSFISVTPAMVGLVLFCVIALFIKLSAQLKYQLKHNRTAFLKTSKIAVVIFIQTITLAIYLSIIIFQQSLMISAYGPYFFDTRIYQSLSYTSFLLQSVATTTSFNIMRIFFDSFVVLLVLSGYRKRLFKFFVFFLTFYKNPYFLKNIKNYFRKSHRTIAVSTTIVKNHPTALLKTPPLK